jgi:4'-phosphopantetheinyl transferase EntD
MKDHSKDWLRLRKEHPAIESTASDLKKNHIKRKAEADAARHLAQQAYEKGKVSKADWICIIILTWFSITTLYLLITNLVL